MTKKELMLMVRNSYPGDSMRECITEDGELVPYIENVGDELAVFIAHEIGKETEDEWMLHSAIRAIDSAVGDLMAVRTSLSGAMGLELSFQSLEEAAENCAEETGEI